MNIRTLGFILLGLLLCVFAPLREKPASASYDAAILIFDTPDFKLQLMKETQTVFPLEPKSAPGFDFTPGDRFEQRDTRGYHYLGDLTLRVRLGISGPWQKYETAEREEPVQPLDVTGPTLAAA